MTIDHLLLNTESCLSIHSGLIPAPAWIPKFEDAYRKWPL